MENESALEIEIAKIKAKYDEQAQLEIERCRLSFEVDGARKALESKHQAESLAHIAMQDAERKEFEFKYGVSFKPKEPILSTIGSKCKYVSKLIDKDGNLKYTYNGTDIIGVKGTPIKSTIIFKDDNGDKQTLSVSTLKSFLR